MKKIMLYAVYFLSELIFLGKGLGVSFLRVCSVLFLLRLSRHSLLLLCIGSKLDAILGGCFCV